MDCNVFGDISKSRWQFRVRTLSTNKILRSYDHFKDFGQDFVLFLETHTVYFALKLVFPGLQLQKRLRGENVFLAHNIFSKL